VDQIPVVNSTDYDLEVHVTGRERDGWRLQVPTEVEERLRQLGRSPSG
jgi:hypothetical protein